MNLIDFPYFCMSLILLFSYHITPKFIRVYMFIIFILLNQFHSSGVYDAAVLSLARCDSICWIHAGERLKPQPNTL